MSTPRRRIRENLSGIVSTLVTGIWLAALFLGFDWWLPFMLFGYVVLVPITALVFGDEEAVEEHWEDVTDTGTDRSQQTGTADVDGDEALQRLRERYANGDLTEAQFERKLDRLLETETIEDVEDQKRRARELNRE